MILQIAVEGVHLAKFPAMCSRVPQLRGLLLLDVFLVLVAGGRQKGSKVFAKSFPLQV
jgi:hypothetical protein